jgi:ribosomal protein S18 acetylase RimI-like enzyme
MAIPLASYDCRVSVHIRPAGPLDLEVIEAIENEADRLLIERLQPDRWEPAPVGASRESEHRYVLVAEVDPRTLVGFVHVLEAEGLAHLEQLSVLPEHGRRGYGRMLVDAAKDKARQIWATRSNGDSASIATPGSRSAIGRQPGSLALYALLQASSATRVACPDR